MKFCQFFRRAPWTGPSRRGRIARISIPRSINPLRSYQHRYDPSGRYKQTGVRVANDPEDGVDNDYVGRGRNVLESEEKFARTSSTWDMSVIPHNRLELGLGLPENLHPSTRNYSTSGRCCGSHRRAQRSIEVCIVYFGLRVCRGF